MLLRFRCKNFRSIREEQELSLIAAKTRTEEKSECLIDTPFKDLRLLRCSAIYGPNASGKSNVLTALSVFSQIVSQSQRLWKPNGPIPTYAPFLLDENSKTEESEFEIVFLLESSIYRYGFRFNQTIIRREWLIDTTNRDKVLFVRTTENSSADLSFPNKNLGKTLEDSRHLEGIRMDVRPNSLFLSAAAQKNHPRLSKIAAYLSDLVETTRGQNIPPFLMRTASACAESNRREQIAKMMKFADTGIQGLAVSSSEMPDVQKKPFLAFITALKEANPEEFSQMEPDGIAFPPTFEVLMTHQGAEGKTYSLSESQESDGTLAYFSILGPLLDKLRDGTILLIDELESSLHPTLARELVRIFNSPELNPKGAQIIFTTHNTGLLDPNLLRRDQIWFTEKTREGSTSLYPLSDYQPRTNQNIEAGYLGGRFGAIPFLDDHLLREALIPREPAQTSLQFIGEE
jgi:AAA15 family ATPase/GTPase